MTSKRRRSGKSGTKGARRTVALGIDDWRVPVHSHLSYLWTNPKEFADTAGFLEAGLRSQDYCLLVGSKNTSGRIVSLLGERGLDVEALRAAGRLALFRGARSAEAMLATFGAELERAVAAGAPLVRFLGVPAWGDAEWPDDESLLSVESSVNALARRYPTVIVCGYDVRLLPGTTVDRGGVGTHPLVLTAGRLIDSSDSIPASAFVTSLTYAVQSAAERRRVEEALAAERARLDSITDAALSYLGLDDLLRELLARLRRALPADFASVRLIDQEAQVLALRAVDGAPFERLVSVPIPLESALPITLGAPFVVNDLQAPPAGSDDWYARVWSAIDLPLRAAMGMPLRVEGRTIGILNVASTRTPFTEEDQRILRVVADRVAPAIERGWLVETVEESRLRLAALSERLVDVQEAERRDIARELHDEVGQLLTGLLFRIAGHGGGGGSPEDEMTAIVNDVISRVRDLSMNLRPPMLDDLGLLAALTWQVDRFETQTGIHVEFRHADLDRRFDPQVEITTFRFVQEALTNVARHAGVGRAKVDVWAVAESVGARIEDEGRGFDVGPALVARSGGLNGMRERSRLAGGSVDIDSQPGRGTRLSLELPLARARPRRADAGD
jgi:signal transduction histidine kinase